MRKTALIASMLVTVALLGGVLPGTGMASAQTTTDYDDDNDGLIDVRTLAQLNAIRYDLDGDGDAVHADYIAAFPRRDTSGGGRMGCPSGTCTGYELRANLDFDTDGDGATYTTSSTGAVTGDSGDAYYNAATGWTPLGGHQETANQDFTATFEGNDHTVSNLYINLSTTGASEGNYVGLFGDLTAAATIRNVGLVDPYVANARGGAGHSRTGALAGRNNGGAVSGSYVSGGSVASNQGTVVAVAFPMAGCLLGYSQGTVSDSYATCTATATGADDAADRAGGLIGWNAGTVRDSYAAGTVAGDLQAGGLVGFSSGSNGLVTDSYATGAVSASAAGGYAGGLVGFNNAAADVIGSYATGAVLASGSSSYVGGLLGKAGSPGTQVRASYATGAVSTSGDNGNAGGLVGWLEEGATIVASYATGAVSASGGGTNHLGGLLARIQIRSSSVTNSYWDTQTSGQTASAAGVGKTTSELQSPTGYTGIYAGWNLNLDGQDGNDDPWHFGTGSQYPVLQYGGQDYRAQRGDYDWDDDGLIEVNSLAKLDAIRWDLNGDGSVDMGTSVADTAKYSAAFAGAVAGMGCLHDHDNNTATPKIAGCIGYELTRDLDFDTDGDGATYTTSSAGAVTGDAGDDYYNGDKGWKPIGGDVINRFTAAFDGNGKIIANLFIQDAGANDVGLFGRAGPGGGRIERLGLRNVKVTGRDLVGGLVGYNSGATISASYVTGSVTGASQVGGLVGMKYLGAISASYTTASVTGNDRVGGLAGRNSGATTSASYATGSVTGGDFVGGLAGVNYGVIRASYATGSVTGSNRVGGLVGRNNAAGVITASYATGSVTGSATDASNGATNVGGLAGFNSGAIKASYATGSVTGTATDASNGASNVGGLAGFNNGAISASYATGSVAGATNVGGLAGSNASNSSSQPRTVTNSYATGAVKGTGSNVGGLVGSDQAGLAFRGTATNSYWDTGTTGQAASAGGAGKTSRDLQSPAGYSGIYAAWNTNLDGVAGNDNPWDFGANRQYPVLNYGSLAPSQQRQVAIRSDNWNAPVVGEPVVASLNVTGAAGTTWQWQSSTNGSTWTDVTNATGATYVPVAADAASGGKFLRAKVTFTVSASSRTLTTVNTAKVVASTPATAATTTALRLVVGNKVQYGISVTGAADHAWRWQRCDNAGMTTNCVYVAEATTATAEYTPVAGDVGKYLRAYAYYAASDAGKTWTRTETPVLGPVVAAPAASP